MMSRRQAARIRALLSRSRSERRSARFSICRAIGEGPPRADRGSRIGEKFGSKAFADPNFSTFE